MVVSILQTTRDSTNKDDRVSGLLVKRSNRLSLKQYPYCRCSIQQPHSYHDLQKSAELLEALDKNEREESAKHAVVASTSLRVFDMIEVRIN